MSKDYAVKTVPFGHQKEDFDLNAEKAAWGRWWEQGTGKTKAVIDEVSYLFLDGRINGLVVLAPNGVHRNWVSDEIPTHMPDAVQAKMSAHIWYSNKAATKGHQRAFELVLHHRGLAVLVMSYDSIMTAKGQAAWKKFLKTRECVYVLDESQRIKNPGAKRTKRIIGSHAASPFRRALSGTPVANNPFDVYTQLKFLDHDVWTKYGIKDFSAFKQFFGVWETWERKDGKHYPKCVAYRNLNILNAEMARLGSRITKEQVLDLPPKLYSKRYFDMSAEQAALYNGIRENILFELAEGTITSMLALVRLLRLQQVTCGYVPLDEVAMMQSVNAPTQGSPTEAQPDFYRIKGPNPRVEVLVETCEDIPHSGIIWARFKEDLRLISEHPFFKGHCVIADGSVPIQQRGLRLDAFQKGDVQWLLGNPAAIGTGVTLTAARTCIYYSNSFNAEHRWQSEDRAHRIGQKHPVDYIDIIANGTVDLKIVSVLREKLDVASQITGDTLREWI